MLSVNRSAKFDELKERVDPKFKDMCIDVIKRDNFTCQCCGFRSPKFMKVIANDSHYTSYDASNYKTACIFCFLEHRLELAGKANAGKIVYLPEISQAQLNSLCHAVWKEQEVSETYSGVMTPDSIISHIETRIKETISFLGKQAFNPSVMSQALKDMSADYYNNREKSLTDFRFLPDKDKFEQYITYWAKNVYPTWKSPCE